MGGLKTANTASSKRTFVTGAAILAVAGLVGKVIGAVYRVILTAAIGSEATGLWQMAYPTYSLLLVISSAGLPAAISRLVAEHFSTGDDAGARRVFVVSFRILLIVGLVTSVAQAALSGVLSAAQGNANAAPSYLALAPALLFVSLVSAYRGYFQGMQRMTPTSLSQIAEQLGRLLLGLYFANMLMPMGIQYAAAGAMVGVSIAELCALLLMMGAYAGHKRTHRIKPSSEPFGSVAKRIAAIAVPVTIGASIMPIVGLADSAIVIRRLIAAGFEQNAATSMYGVLTGIVNPIINMPAVITLSLSMSLVPALSAARVKKDAEAISRSASVGLKLAILIGLPAAVGLYLLAGPIVGFLFGGRGSITAEEVAQGAGMLRTMAAGVLFLSVVQTTTGVMQGLGKPMRPVIHLAIGAALKVAINYTLVGMPSVNIQGAPVGTLICYGVAAVLNVVVMIRESGVRPRLSTTVLKPALAALGMGVAVFALSAVLAGRVSDSLLIAAAVGVGFLCYAALLLLTGSLTREDCAMLPGGARLMRALPRFIK